ncbi:MAG: hypothetical protein QMC95_07750 [Desulfitobacteriaceae bacterium]|nr:hypothetical protein [Desulfitobacteriaceae bacterium]MDI6914101.1 hypothetical protein [Desulfitobacteriaceae bacterium]
MFEKQLKVFVMLFLSAGLLFSGLSFSLVPVHASDKDLELTELKLNLETNGMLYVTDNVVPSKKDINFNQENISTQIMKVQKQDMSQLDSTKFRNIVVDVAQLKNRDILNKIKERFARGSRIVFRKDNIRINEAYSLLEENTTQGTFEDKDFAHNGLTTVAISMFKDSSGNIHTAKLNVEDNNDSEVLRLIIIASRDDRDTVRLFQRHEQQGFIQDIRPVYASLSTSWLYVRPWSSYDSWSTVDINYSYNVYKNPNNPSGGYYLSMEETSLTVTPRDGYLSGNVYVYHDSASGGTENYYAPQAQTNVNSVNLSFGYPPSTGLSFSLGTKMNIRLSSGGQGHAYTQWQFYPVGALGGVLPTKYQTYYEPTDQYYQPGSYFNQGFAYWVDMYVASSPEVVVDTVSHTGMYVSGS